MMKEMVFKDVETAVNFLLDLGNILPEFEILPPQNPNEEMRAVDSGDVIILYKNRTMEAGGDILPMFLCDKFCKIIGKYSVWDIRDKGEDV